jgi:hypothetical protein
MSTGAFRMTVRWDGRYEELDFRIAFRAPIPRQGIIASDTLRPKSLIDQKVLSAMGVPLLSGARVLGFIHVDDREDSAPPALAAPTAPRGPAPTRSGRPGQTDIDSSFKREHNRSPSHTSHAWGFLAISALHPLLPLV